MFSAEPPVLVYLAVLYELDQIRAGAGLLVHFAAMLLQLRLSSLEPDVQLLQRLLLRQHLHPSLQEAEEEQGHRSFIHSWIKFITTDMIYLRKYSSSLIV